MTKDDILRLLTISKSAFVSGEKLALKLNITRAAVWKHIKALEQEGYEIEAVPSKGYRLMSIPDAINLRDIEAAVKTKMIGRKVHLLAEVESTNSAAVEMAAAGAPEGTIVAAEVQTGGKGRLGRTWISPKGNLYLSVILRPKIAPNKAPLVTLMGAVAVVSAIRKQTEVHAQIKWPNDIFSGERKIGGLLTEMRAEPDQVRHIVLGIGLNVNMNAASLPPAVASLATTLSAETGSPVNRTGLLVEIASELDRWYQTFLKNDAEILRAWEAMNMTIGRQVTVSSANETIQGTAEAIDHDGRLVIRTIDGALQAVAAGDVTLVKRGTDTETL
ncbi:MAG TPA: biotin--[acetyl-CoA-carboxylase] ligase [Nitrospiraceae bacterium]|nr:biotin--[acetyl-CoA-carboxylase] ligase [Nitrospiraceae bacterium]